MTDDLPTPGQVSAEDRERVATSPPTHRVPATPGSIRCRSCNGPVLRFPNGDLRCVEEGRDLQPPGTYVEPDS